MMRRGAKAALRQKRISMDAEQQRGAGKALLRRILGERKTASRRWDGAAAALKPESNLILAATLAPRRQR